jgi:hypothetical protein
MEAEEYGEMMESVDEVNFALDGMRPTAPRRVRRASMLSLLGICASAAHRRTLRAQGSVRRSLLALSNWVLALLFLFGANLDLVLLGLRNWGFLWVQRFRFCTSQELGPTLERNHLWPSKPPARSVLGLLKVM